MRHTHHTHHTHERSAHSEDDHEHNHGGHDHGGHDHGGHDHGDHAAQFRRLFIIMCVFAVPTVAFNAMFAQLLGYSLPDVAWIPWISPVLGTVMFFWGGWPFLQGGAEELRAKQPGMMLLISLALTVAFGASLGMSFGVLDRQLDFWWELALLTVIMLLGHWIEMRSLAQTTHALDALAQLLPDQAEKLVGDEIVQVTPDELRVDDVVIIRPGGSVPADGQVIQGEAHMDESMITGESHPVKRGVDDRVVSGTVATDSGIRVKITAIGDDTALAGIEQLVREAQSSSSRAQRLADTAAAWLFWYALAAAVLTAVVWSLVGVPEDAVVRTITVLVIACPHALGLAIPLVVSIATQKAAQSGVLVKDRLALESMRTVTSVLFDKTGTLTRGEPAVTEVITVKGWRELEVLRLAAAAEHESEHPLAQAIVQRARDERIAIPSATDFSSSPAEGVRASIEGATIAVGGPYLLERERAHELDGVEPWREQGSIILHVLRDGEVIGALQLADEVRDTAKATVQQLHDAGVNVVMLTGDAQAVAEHVARELGIDEVFAGVRPEEKAERVTQLRARGEVVAMVGDGVNDAPALASADVGIAIGAGTDVAIGSAGVVLASSDPQAVLKVLTLSQATYRKMKQNLWWAAGYNLLAVPLAAGVLAPIGFVLPMSVGAMLMSLSTIVVALNAQLLRRLDLSSRGADV